MRTGGGACVVMQKTCRDYHMLIPPESPPYDLANWWEWGLGKKHTKQTHIFLISLSALVTGQCIETQHGSGFFPFKSVVPVLIIFPIRDSESEAHFGNDAS